MASSILMILIVNIELDDLCFYELNYNILRNIAKVWVWIVKVRSLSQFQALNIPKTAKKIQRQNIPFLGGF